MSFVEVQRTPSGIKLVIGEDVTVRLVNEEAEKLSKDIKDALKIEQDKEEEKCFFCCEIGKHSETCYTLKERNDSDNY